MKELKQLQEVDLAAVNIQQGIADQSFMYAKVSPNPNLVNKILLLDEPLMEIVGNNSMTLNDLASFIISLCWLSAEASSNNIANDRCVALDRASLDLGILWNYASDDDDT